MKNLRYYFMVLLGGTLYGTMSSFVKLSYKEGFTVAQISFWQAFISAIILTICTITSLKEPQPLSKKGYFPLLLTGASIGLTNFLYYASVFYIPASLAIIILMQFTWFSLLLEWIIFRHKPSVTELTTTFFILIGTLLAGNIFELNVHDFSLKGITLAFSSSITYAVYIMANSRVGKGINWKPKSMFIMIGSSLCILLINTNQIINTNYLAPNFLAWAVFLAVIGTTIPTALFSIGFSKIGASISSILMTVELPVAVMCAALILHERINSVQMGGVIIMLTSISAMNYYKATKTH